MNVDVQLTEPVKPSECTLQSCSTAVHWPVSQGTYLRKMNLTVGGGLTGIFGEAGSGGLIADVAISGGDYGMQFGNQQWVFRDVTITGARIAGIQVLWNWVRAIRYSHHRLNLCAHKS